jgi:SAM-dependent methyltransferase
VAKSYEDQLQEQIEQYRDTEDMHDLPAAFHLWSRDYVLPGLLKVFGVSDFNQFYVEAFVAAAKHNPNPPIFLSLGCGDGAVEIGIARTLLEQGVTRFRFVCYDLSDILLSRFRAALPPELAGHFELLAGDLNAQAFDIRFDAIMANHSLHHMVDLEGIFRTAFDCLTDDGIFVTSDMIGRNGHMRWPETRLFVDFFWPFMSERQRNNILLHRTEPQFIDHDCSSEGFEGIRSQDVLPLILAQGFHPSRFLGFGGMIDVFVDRCFGPNFDVNNDDDAFLLRRIAFLNDVLLDAGLIKPTMMLAYFVKQPVAEICFRNRSAHAAVRQAASDPRWLADAVEDYARNPADPHFVFRPRPLRPQRSEPPRGIDRSELDHARTDAANAHKAMGEAIAALRHAQNEAAAAQTRTMQQALRIQGLENSTSWRLTAPMRILARRLRRRRVP